MTNDVTNDVIDNGIDSKLSRLRLRLQPNAIGRDFVIGDLHGCYDLLMVELEKISFDKSRDRLISVGDLVDRGPDSLKCLELLASSLLSSTPWFYAVLGNHEQMMLGYYSATGVFPKGGYSEYGRYWHMNGGGWGVGSGLDSRAINPLLEMVCALPFMITVEGQFHVIHAELNSRGKPITEELLESDFEELAFSQCSDGAYILWGREVFYWAYGKDLNDPKNLEKFKRYLEINKLVNTKTLPIYCGHTTVQRPLQVGSLINLDTGAYRVGNRDWAKLTMVEATKADSRILILES